MSYDKSNRDNENSKSRKTRSNYFQTEFSISFNKKKEEKSCSSSSSQSVPDDTFERNQQQQVKKKNISVQAGRNIIGQEKIPKERKKWIRPPLVGQASTSTDVIIPVHQELGSDSEEEIIETSHPTIEPTNFGSRNDYRNRKDYINEKPPEGGAVDAEISPITNQSDYVKSAASPTSSVTSSRPLEWDSGADVGYVQFYPDQSNDAELSTLERLALQRGSAILLTRSDPEGTTGNSVKPNAPIGRPTAESTPVNTLSTNEDNTSTERNNYPLFPEVIVKEHQVSDSDIETNKPSAEAAVKKSNSLEVVGETKTDQRPATFPRSQSQTNIVFNINPHLQKILANTKSNSSSSVATVVTGRKKITNNSPESEVSTGDRANSFEYLPGHVYENKTNGTPVMDGQHFKDDVERGVKLLADFVKGSNANNTLLRKELLQRVVEGLISAEYLSDREWSPILKRCVTRRSHNRDISGESSTADDHHSRSIEKESSTRSSSVRSNHTTNVSSQNTSRETSDSLFRVNARKMETQKLSHQEGAINILPRSKTFVKSSDSSKISSSDWKKPFTKSEKIFEAKKVADVSASPIDGKLLQYLYSERANQIDWIKKEINHLSNLKKLLERHENLKKNFATLKKKKLKAVSADAAVKSSLPNRNLTELSKAMQSEPVIGFHREADGGYEKNTSVESDYNSHNYESDRGDGILRRHASTDTRDVRIKPGWETQSDSKRSLAYTIIFEPKKEKENIDHKGVNGERIFEEKPVIDRETLMKMSRHKIKEQFSKMSLQDELLLKRPDYVARAEGRRHIVAELTALRELRQQHKANVLAAAVSNSAPPIPPAPLAVKRVVSQRQMRSLTEKKYKQTFEVQQRKQDLKRKEDYRTNRLMAEVFKKKLQRRTLQGETDLSNSINVIS